MVISKIEIIIGSLCLSAEINFEDYSSSNLLLLKNINELLKKAISF